MPRELPFLATVEAYMRIGLGATAMVLAAFGAYHLDSLVAFAQAVTAGA